MWFTLEGTGEGGSETKQGSFCFGKRKFAVILFWHVDDDWRHWELTAHSQNVVGATPAAIGATEIGGSDLTGALFAGQKSEQEEALIRTHAKALADFEGDHQHQLGVTFDVRDTEEYERQPQSKSVSCHASLPKYLWKLPLRLKSFFSVSNQN